MKKPAKSSPHGKAPAPEGSEAPERIAKRMARAGLCSRREAERWIEEGRVAVNGKVLKTPAVLVGLKDRVSVDGNLLEAKERTRLWLYHKPSGLVTTANDPEGRSTVFASLPEELPRVISVGRLDINTEGLLLLTNDGGLSRQLELPSTGWLRRYRVRVHGKVDAERLDALKDGIAVDGVLYGAIEASVDREQGRNTWITLSLREGKNREIKNVLGALGLEVTRLIRISYGPFQLGDLDKGSVREIRGRTLRDQLGDRLIAAAGADFSTPPKQTTSKNGTNQKPKTKRANRSSPLDRLDTNRSRLNECSNAPTGRKKSGGRGSSATASGTKKSSNADRRR